MLGDREYEFRGWTFVEHEKMHFDEHALKYPSRTILDRDGVVVQKCYIPFTYTVSRIVYFIDIDNRDYGQYPDEWGARKVAELLLANRNNN